MPDDEEPEQSGYDPRWEVQPEPTDEDDSGRDRPRAFISLVAIAGIVALVVWLVLDSTPAV